MNKYSPKYFIPKPQFHLMMMGKLHWYSFLAKHRENKFTWIAHVLFPEGINHNKVLAKLKRHYPRDDYPAVCRRERHKGSIKLNLHFLGRGPVKGMYLDQWKARMIEFFIDCLCDDKRRQHERDEWRKKLSKIKFLEVTQIEGLPWRNFETALNYFLKSTPDHASKIQPLGAYVRNFIDLGIYPEKGGMTAFRKRLYKEYRERVEQGWALPEGFDPDKPDKKTIDEILRDIIKPPEDF